MFDMSLLRVMGRDGDGVPWRWNPAPVYGNGPMQPPTVPGTQQVPTGVFILLSGQLISMLKDNLTQAQKDELQTWVTRYTEAECAEWHVPVWAGQQEAYYVRVPAAIWSDPTTNPPQKVKNYLQNLWREAQ